MSYGLVCLKCRRYVWHAALGTVDRAHYCQCASLGITPQPSLDARREATPAQVAAWWAERAGGEGRAEKGRQMREWWQKRKQHESTPEAP